MMNLFNIIILVLMLLLAAFAFAIAQFTTIDISGSSLLLSDCASFTITSKLQLRIDHQKKLLQGCETHSIFPNITMSNHYMYWCHNNLTNCTVIDGNRTHLDIVDDFKLIIAYQFCNTSNSRIYPIWTEFSLLINGLNFMLQNDSGNHIPIRNCNAGGTFPGGTWFFCRSQTDDLTCNFDVPSPQPSTNGSTSSSGPTTISALTNSTSSDYISTVSTKHPTIYQTSPSSADSTSYAYTSPSSTSHTISYPTSPSTNPLSTNTFSSSTTIYPTSHSSSSDSTSYEYTSPPSTYRTISYPSSSSTLSTNPFSSSSLSSTSTYSPTFTPINTPTLSSTMTSSATTTSSLTNASISTLTSNSISTESSSSISSTTARNSTTSNTVISTPSSPITTTLQTTRSTTLSTTPTITTTRRETTITLVNNSSTTTTIQTTESSSPIISTSTMFSTETPFVFPPNPYDIDCTNFTLNDGLYGLYCWIESTNYTAANISDLINKTLANINATELTPKEVFAVLRIFKKCSEITNLTHEAFDSMGTLVDAMLEGPAESFIQTHIDGVQTTKTIVDSVTRMFLNAPPDVGYLNGKNLALLGKSLNCHNNADAGSLTDVDNGFKNGTVNEKKIRASISIDGKIACEGQGTRVFYTIYRNTKFFIKNQPTSSSSFLTKFAAATETASMTTDDTSDAKSKKCTPDFFDTEGGILSGTVVQNDSSTTSPSFLHKFAKNGEDQNIVTLKFNKKDIGVFLHGKLKISWWDEKNGEWSPETCIVEDVDGYYISKCTHLTDFTLLVDGINVDPILCNKALEIVNYIVAIGSMFSLLILNIVYVIILIPRLSEKIFSNIFLKIVPNSDKNIVSFVYSFILFLFFFTFTLFSNQGQVVVKTGCLVVAALNYWLLVNCIMLSLFQSWRIVKMFVWTSGLERLFHIITMKKVVYPMTFTISTSMTVFFGVFTQGDFFRRNDSFCWIRPDFLVAAVVVPLTILAVNAILTCLVMSLRLFPHFGFSKLIRTSSIKINKISNKEARERVLVLFLVQFTLGVPWLLQYLTLFEPKATAWHFLFVIVNGSQGIIILISFIYRCYGTYKTNQRLQTLWK